MSRTSDPDAGTRRSRARDEEETGPDRVESAFERTVDEGRSRLNRTWPALLATGTIGGLDVGVGLLALFVVAHETGSLLLGALAFTVGFLALSLANSELFTENFLVPISTVAADRLGPRSVLRLWFGTGVMNLVGGWVLMAFVVVGLPDITSVPLELARKTMDMGIGTEAFASAILAGMVITLMTWMEHSTEAVVAKIAAAIATGFVLVAPPLNHAIVSSLEAFAALQAGAPFGYADWAGAFAWATAGNIVGGVGLVTVLRFVQVGGHKIGDEQARPPS